MHRSMETLFPIIQEGLLEGKEVVLPVFGRSMEPFLYSKDTVTLKRVENIEKHDIVFYRRTNGQFVLHRVHHLKDKQLFMVGDHQWKIEGPIAAVQCYGIVVASTRKKKNRQGRGNRFFLSLWHPLWLRWIFIHIYNLFHR